MRFLIWIYALCIQHIDWQVLLGGPLLLACGIAFNMRLNKFRMRLLDWAPFRIQTNIVLWPILKSRFWLLYTAVLCILVPLFAFAEELIFRAQPFEIVIRVIWGSLIFGLAHLTSFVSLRMCLYLSVLGLVFVGVYALGGFWVVWTLHSAYNWSAIGLAAYAKYGRKYDYQGRLKFLNPLLENV